MDNHEKFLNHLDGSRASVARVAGFFCRRGYSVSMPPESRAESHGDWRNHADGGDLFVHQRIEVKSLSAVFSCAEDWPFGDKFIVCAAHSFDAAMPKPYAYFMLSGDGAGAAYVMSANSRRWTRERRRDSRYVGVDQEFYFSPMGDVSFISID